MNTGQAAPDWAGLPDAIQLATALEIGAWALVTHGRDFSGVEDVRIVM